MVSSTVFQTVPVGADSETTNANAPIGSGTVDLSVGETEIISFDFTSQATGDAGTFSVDSGPIVGNLNVDNAATGTATFTITQAQWIGAGSPASVAFSIVSDDDANGAEYTLNITCFSEGTAIATPMGETNVEDLQFGELIRTHDGREVPVRWVGRQTVNAAFADVPERMQLVRIAAGALGDGLPKRDLRVTVDHAMYLEGLMINAGALVGLPGIEFVPLAEVGASYKVYHVEVDRHEVILAEGSPTESFIDLGSRATFDNYDEYITFFGVDRIIEEYPAQRISSSRLLPTFLKDYLMHLASAA